MTASMRTRVITAYFEDRQDALEAIQRLEASGISRSEINMVEGSQAAPAQRSSEASGFWEALKDLFLPDEDRHTYAEGLRRGGYLVTVRTNDAQHARAVDILDDEGTIDIDERAAAWRSEGWAPSSSSGYAAGSRSSAASPSGGTAKTGRSPREEVIPLSEEQLRVGKRDVTQGRVRVRSYVVEAPVQKQVNLKEERVSVERRPVDRPASGDQGLFRERTIEAEERTQQAVVDKQARVKEEVVLKKDVGQRTETISDKVRRTEVEVEDERGRTARPSGPKAR